MMNTAELSSILYYADYISLSETNTPVTDNCKYFFIHGAPINSLYILDMEPEYDEENQYFQQAKLEYDAIKNKFGSDGIESFINDICCINACGTVDAVRMLNKIHQYSPKQIRKQALHNYYNWKNNQIFTHTTINENGDTVERQCTKYTYHVERMLGRPKLDQNGTTNRARY